MLGPDDNASSAASREIPSAAGLTVCDCRTRRQRGNFNRGRLSEVFISEHNDYWRRPSSLGTFHGRNPDD
jgi:hypothetical protein